MNEWQERTELLLGDKIERIREANVLVIGLGGVGAMAAEILCRSGIGQMTIADGDTVHESNINRQFIATQNTVGKSKAEELGKRFLNINPNLKLNVINDFIPDEKMADLLKSDEFDYIIDAIDTIAPKVSLIYNAFKLQIPIISSMGAGGRIDPSKVMVSDISKSFNCPLARSVRKRLHKMKVYKGVKVVFSSEISNKDSLVFVEEKNKKTSLGTISYLPAIFGIYAASEVIRDLIKD